MICILPYFSHFLKSINRTWFLSNYSSPPTITELAKFKPVQNSISPQAFLLPFHLLPLCCLHHASQSSSSYHHIILLILLILLIIFYHYPYHLHKGILKTNGWGIRLYSLLIFLLQYFVYSVTCSVE